MRRALFASLVMLVSTMGALSACNALLDDFVYVDASTPPGDEVTPGLDASTDATGPSGEGSADGASEAAPLADTGAADEDGGDDGGGVSPLTYEKVVLDAMPSAYWRLDEMVGPRANNFAPSGNRYDAMYFANVTYDVPGAIVGDSDPAIHLSGAVATVLLASGFPSFGARAFTLELWMRPTVADSNAYELLIKAVAPTAGVQLFYQDTGGRALHGVEYLGNVGTYDNAKTDPVVSAWSHVALESDGTELALFLNGDQVDLQPLANLGADAGDAGDAGTTFSIGADENGFSPFTGDIDEVAVYGYELPAVEIRRHYNVGSGRDAGM